MRGGSIALGTVIVALGAIWLLEATGSVDLDTGVWVGILLVGIGVGVIASPPGSARVLLLVIGLLVALVGGALAATNVEISGGIGDRNETPESVADLEDPYEHGIGSLRLDLTELALNADTTVRAQIGIGELHVTVPRDWPLVIEADLGAGEIVLLGEREDGFDPEASAETDGDPGAPELRLELEGGIGQIRVVRGF